MLWLGWGFLCFLLLVGGLGELGTRLGMKAYSTVTQSVYVLPYDIQPIARNVGSKVFGLKMGKGMAVCCDGVVMWVLSQHTGALGKFLHVKSPIAAYMGM